MTEAKNLYQNRRSVYALGKNLPISEQDGLINRKVYAQIPPKVEYSLTDIGKKFQSVLNELEIWGNDYIDYLKENREAV